MRKELTGEPHVKYDNLLHRYLSGPDSLNSTLKKLSSKDLEYRPDRPDAWTIKEHIIHLVDSEVNGFIRCKSILAQPNSECYVMEEEVWTRNIRRKDEDVKKYLQLFSLIRKIVFDLLKDEPEENWTNNYFIRTYRGETARITIEKCMELYCNHLAFHLEHIDKIKAGLRRP